MFLDDIISSADELDYEIDDIWALDAVLQESAQVEPPSPLPSTPASTLATETGTPLTESTSNSILIEIPLPSSSTGPAATIVSNSDTGTSGSSGTSTSISISPLSPIIITSDLTSSSIGTSNTDTSNTDTSSTDTSTTLIPPSSIGTTSTTATSSKVVGIISPSSKDTPIIPTSTSTNLSSIAQTVAKYKAHVASHPDSYQNNRNKGSLQDREKVYGSSYNGRGGTANGEGSSVGNVNNDGNRNYFNSSGVPARLSTLPPRPSFLPTQPNQQSRKQRRVQRNYFNSNANSTPLGGNTRLHSSSSTSNSTSISTSNNSRMLDLVRSAEGRKTIEQFLASTPHPLPPKPSSFSLAPIPDQVFIAQPRTSTSTNIANSQQTVVEYQQQLTELQKFQLVQQHQTLQFEQQQQQQQQQFEQQQQQQLSNQQHMKEMLQLTHQHEEMVLKLTPKPFPSNYNSNSLKITTAAGEVVVSDFAFNKACKVAGNDPIEAIKAIAEVLGGDAAGIKGSKDVEGPKVSGNVGGIKRKIGVSDVPDSGRERKRIEGSQSPFNEFIPAREGGKSPSFIINTPPISASLSTPSLPSFPFPSVPSFPVPPLSLPSLSLPPLSLPPLSVPTFSFPSFPLPSFSLPSFNNLPPSQGYPGEK